ncbi:flagellar export chaperone FliS [uncultured Roseibium sp.]|uniref:flagellar export chaperone FliS n=1 Tax=uncultured Roseibium sp. TaxID=1936171 RepID=UPI003216DF09
MSIRMNQAISAYRQASTAVPPLSALVLLFDEALNALILASRHTRQGEYEQANLRTQRAIAILRGLRQNLDLEKGGDFARQLCDAYTRNIFALNASIGKKDAVERYRKLATGLLDLRNAWSELTTLSERALEPLLNEIEGISAVNNVA